MIVDPKSIEEKSFDIIRSELGETLPPEIEPILLRMIHTSADFEYRQITRFQNDAVSRGLEALRGGCRIYADTSMICSGVSKPALKRYGCELFTLIGDGNVAAEARREGVTRSIVAMREACRDSRVKIFLIGNAPTALFTLMEAIDRGEVSPSLVVGVPVGFVGAEESKEQLAERDVPAIITQGRKGGSTIAVSIINAFFKILDRR